MKSQKEIDER